MSYEIWILHVTAFHSYGSNQTTSVSFPIPKEGHDAFMKLPFSQREEIVRSWVQWAMPTLLQQIEQSTCPPSPSPSSDTSFECSSTNTPDSLIRQQEVEVLSVQRSPSKQDTS